MEYFVIKDTNTELYSTGGEYPSWADFQHAKRWNKINHVHSHITAVSNPSIVYRTAKIMKVEYSPEESEFENVIDYAAKIKAKKDNLARIYREERKLHEYNKAKQIVEQFEGDSMT